MTNATQLKATNKSNKQQQQQIGEECQLQQQLKQRGGGNIQSNVDCCKTCQKYLIQMRTCLPQQQAQQQL